MKVTRSYGLIKCDICGCLVTEYNYIEDDGLALCDYCYTVDYNE